jgi:hypothetical protein
MEVPLLERLAHTPKDLIPSNLALMKIRVSGNWEARKNAIIDPNTGGCLWFYRSLAEAKDAFNDGPLMFTAGIRPFAVAIPSVIVPVWNVVLFHRGLGFWNHVLLESLNALEFDPRLFPENAPAEAPDQDITL